MKDLISPAARGTRRAFTHRMIVCAGAAIAVMTILPSASADQHERQQASSGPGKRVPTILARPTRR